MAIGKIYVASSSVPPLRDASQRSDDKHVIQGGGASCFQDHQHPVELKAKRDQQATLSSSQGLTLPAPSRRLLWCYILVYQLLNCTLLSCLAAMYGSANMRGSILWFLGSAFLFSHALTFLSTVSLYVSIGYALLALVFAHGALLMLWDSVKQRRLCFGPAPVAKAQSQTRSTTQRGVVFSAVLASIKKLVSVYALFGLRGRYFAIGFFVREVIESALQTTQAYKSSRSLSNVFVNQSYGVLIFLNCFVCALSPLLRRSSATNGRLLCVLIDLTLDFAWGTVIPLVVFWPYLQMFFDDQDGTYVPIPMENVQQEVEFILVLSTSDFILSTFPFMSSAANLRGVKRLLSTLDKQGEPASSIIAIATAPNGANDQAAATPNSADQVLTGTATRTRTRKFLTVLSHGLFLLYGVAILAISVASMSSAPHSSATTASYACLHRVYPWLTTKEACVGRIIDCPKAGINGTREEIVDALLLYDESTLSNLVFTRCQQLEIPAAVHRFEHLSVLTIRHSEVHNWSRDAALTDEFFSGLQTVRLHNTSFACIPEGLVDVRLPRSTEFVFLADVDMAPLITRVGDNWQHLKYFYCDGCNLPAFPAAVRTMTELLELSLMSNNISVIEEHDIAPLAALQSLWIDGSPVAALPDALWRKCSTFGDLSLQYTQVASIPEWVDDFAGGNLRVFAFDSPLCANNASASSGATASKHSFVHCHENVP